MENLYIKILKTVCVSQHIGGGTSSIPYNFTLLTKIFKNLFTTQPLLTLPIYLLQLMSLFLVLFYSDFTV